MAKNFDKVEGLEIINGKVQLTEEDPYIEALRGKLYEKRNKEHPRYFASKHVGSHTYEDPGERRKRHKRQRRNRKAGR